MQIKTGLIIAIIHSFMRARSPAIKLDDDIIRFMQALI